MCGICGVWGEGGREAVERMVAAMRHRGPDDRGVCHDERMALGMSRLAILDLSPAGHQPMSNPEQTVWIACNGEVYNFQSERQALERQGETFRSHSDTEVVLRLYERYGDDFLLRLRGMFALAIYDKRRGPGRERLLLARDPMGIKPLLFARTGAGLAFASEMKALLAGGRVRREVDPVALRMLLTYGSVYQPRTMLRGVDMLLPAHRLVAESGGIRIERYWTLGVDREPKLNRRPYGELVEEMAARLEESVRLHMVSDVPVGAFLSGGVDSSLLVGLMTRIAGRRVKTFSVGFEAEGAHLDETDEARRTAEFLGSEHTRVVVTGAQVRDRIERIAAGLDQPSVDGVNCYFVSLAARQAVTVAISGTGGDELFAGYPWFAQMALYEKEKARAPARIALETAAGRLACLPVLNRLCRGRWRERLERARGRAGFVPRYAGNYQIFGPAGAADALAPELRAAAQAGQSLYEDLKGIDELPDARAVERASGLCLRGYTSNQLLRDIDAVSMAHSLEVRVPFLDAPLSDFALSLPASCKMGDLNPGVNPWQATYRETGSKRILIDAGRRLGILHPEIDLQPKRGFAMPFGEWLQGPLRDVLEDTLSDATMHQHGWLDRGAAAGIREQFFQRRLDWPKPWLLMMLELWRRGVLEARAS